jgi:hypothetical protein
MSMAWWIDRNDRSGCLLARSAIRWIRVEMVPEFSGSVIVLSFGSVSPVTPSLHQLLWALVRWLRRYYG